MASPFLFSEGHRLPQQPTQRASDDLILLQQLLDIGAVDLAEDLLQGHLFHQIQLHIDGFLACLLYTSPSPRD